MARAWGASFADAWGVAFGSESPEVTPAPTEPPVFAPLLFSVPGRREREIKYRPEPKAVKALPKKAKLAVKAAVRKIEEGNSLLPEVVLRKELDTRDLDYRAAYFDALAVHLEWKKRRLLASIEQGERIEKRRRAEEALILALI